jgi:Protein of unknown function (DUF1326)
MGNSYVLAGAVLEAGDDIQLRIGRAEGRSVAAWRIRSGQIKGIDVSDQVILTVWSHSPGDDGGTALTLLDERAGPDEAAALVEAFQGRLGGPLALLAEPAGHTRLSARVPIEYWTAGRDRVAWVPQRLKVVVRLESWMPLLSAPPGMSGLRPTAEGQASEISVELPEHRLTWRQSDVGVRSFEFRLASN